MMARWMARLAYSFFILAVLLAWEGYKELTRSSHPQTWRIALYFLAAGISVGLSFRGVQERHRGDRE
jgi:hypothetical protein